MKHEKTFEAISKLRDVEIELHRLKNALEMTNRALETKEYERGFIDGMQKQMQSSVDKAVNAMVKREWVGLTDEEKAQFVVAYYPSNWDRKTAVSLMNDYEKYLKERNT